MVAKKIHLVIIDPQNDFCDLPDDYRPAIPCSPGERQIPALPVAGAHADMLRVASLINQGHARLSDISVTLDSHHRVDIADPAFWQRKDGSAVAGFTPINASDVRAGRYVPRNAKTLARVLTYLDSLEANGRYT